MAGKVRTSRPKDDDKIKVRLTKKQREYVEFLVNRRLSDLKYEQGTQTRRMTPEQAAFRVDAVNAELVQLTELKSELQQAET
jgi:hypothetical protein